MTVKIVNAKTVRNLRPFRFPPRSSQAVQDWDADPAAVQRAVSDGFQEGLQKGYEQGLAQGFEAGQREGFEKGREQGVRQGLEEGRKQGRKLFEEASQPLDTLTEKLGEFLDELEQRRRKELLELVTKVSQQVIRCELTLHPTQLLTLAEEALSTMSVVQGDVQILLNPEEYARIRDLAPTRAAAWRLVPDERLALGECRIVTDQAEVDIGCQQRLDSCIETLAKHLQVAES